MTNVFLTGIFKLPSDTVVISIFHSLANYGDFIFSKPTFLKTVIMLVILVIISKYSYMTFFIHTLNKGTCLQISLILKLLYTDLNIALSINLFFFFFKLKYG